MGSFEFDLKPRTHNKKMKVILSSLMFAALVLSTRGQDNQDCSMCMKLADLWDKFDSSSKGLKASRKAVQEVVCDDNVKITCNACRTMGQEFVNALNAAPTRRAAVDIIQANNCKEGDLITGSTVDECNNKVLTFFQDIGR